MGVSTGKRGREETHRCFEIDIGEVEVFAVFGVLAQEVKALARRLV